MYGGTTLFHKPVLRQFQAVILEDSLSVPTVIGFLKQVQTLRNAGFINIKFINTISKRICLIHTISYLKDNSVCSNAFSLHYRDGERLLRGAQLFDRGQCNMTSIEGVHWLNWLGDDL
jgi:hypothetical protein